MGALLGLFAAFAVSSSELFGRRVVNQAGPIVAASTASLVASIVALAISVGGGEAPLLRDLVVGGLSGVGFGLGMASYLQGLRESTSAVVGPVVASLVVLIPFSYSALIEDLPGVLSLLGAAASLLGLVFVTVGGLGVGNVAFGLRWGLISGLAFGVGTAVFIESSGDSGWWPVVSQRAVAFTAIAVFAVASSRPLVPQRSVAGQAVAAGVFAAFSSILLLAGLNLDPAAASVTSALYPASSVVIGRVIFRDSVTRWQIVGLIIVVGGTIAIVLGS
ncbi:MAG: DMT family transporter [Actinomycetia bacterium]|nr:DMT family transporter [Actinomycetes bacterium]